MTARTDRIDQLLRQEIGEILARDVQDPRIGFVTITDVETAPDLSTARVWVSVIGQPEERDRTIRALERAMPFVRHELGSRIRLRRIPDAARQVAEVARELEAGQTPQDEAPIAESLPTPVPRIPPPPAAPDRGRGRRRTHPRR